MGSSYYMFQSFLCLVLIWILKCRPVWCITRRGDFLACGIETEIAQLIDSVKVSLGVDDVDGCISDCTRLNSSAAIVGSNTSGSVICLCSYITSNFEFENSVPFSQCNTPCPGNPLESCGGVERFSVYKITNRSCDDPGIPVNGPLIGDDFVIGSEVEYNCSSGLVIDGPKVSRCWWVDNITLDITWSPSPPSCVDPSSLLTTETPMERETTSAPSVTSSTSGPSPSNMGAIVGSLVAVIILIIIVVMIIVFVCKKRQKRRADISPKSGPSTIPLSDSKAKLTQSSPNKVGEGEDANGVEDEDYLVPDAKLVASAKKASGQGETLQLVDNRPRLPAPPSVKASLSPEESVYENSLSIVLSRSKENLNKDTKNKVVSHEPAYQNRAVVTRQDRARATEGAVAKPPAIKAKSLPLDADGIYQNTQMAVMKNSPRMPLKARSSDGRRESHDSCGTASQRSSLNYRDSFDYVTPNEVTEQEVYENAGLLRPRQGPRRPSDQLAKIAIVIDSNDSDGVYLDLI